MPDSPTMLYENKGLMAMVVDALRPFCSEGEHVIWRAAFRWMDHNGVMPNCYEMFELSEVCEQARLVVVEDFNHVAIVRP